MTGTLIGKRLNDRYQIIDRIGLGGMAEVYLANDLNLGRNVAVKVMLPQYASDATFTRRFKQEAASAARLSSPYIVSIFDWGLDGDLYYIVMELVRGSDLKTGIIERGAINQRKVAEIGSQVCQALSVAHENGIIHRDIKPQNIMVQPDGNIKVMDFGIARAKNAALTQTSTVLGTAHYISPEQAQGKELTESSDIYSLGVVLYEAATGHLPFDGPDAVSVALKQVSEQPQPPRMVNPAIDPALENIIMCAMSKNPAQRFATAGEMRKALLDFLAGRPVATPLAFGAAETAVVGGVAPIAPLADGTQVMPMGAVTPTNPTTATTNYLNNDESDASTKKGKGKIAAAIGAVVALIAVIAFAMTMITGGGGVAVPQVTGMTQEKAEKMIVEAGFKVGEVESSPSDTVKEGLVISQDPESGLKRDKGSTINIVVSAGVEQVEVPDLKNMTADQAVAELEKLGLSAIKGTAEYSDKIAKNHVCGQSPAAGQAVAKGTAVEYVLSLGQELNEVPSVLGFYESSAKQKLEAAGFKVKSVSDYSDEEEGMCYWQEPNEGKLKPGSTVTIGISLGPKPAPEPEPEPEPEPQPDPDP
ncbi:MAG: Stk1 family PASTA domain-containing Ser/Thr kinase, partial [Coriobacteriia bacterium]|nr:Stk1 family PASTA domain-containing Ser/Thr kinase [Coriobacteriia bacterium]